MNNQVNSNSTGFRMPKLTLAWTILAAAGVLGLTFAADWLNESRAIQPGMINLLKVLLVFVTMVVWFVWLTFFSGHRLRWLFTAAALILAGLFFYQFRLIFDGDLGFVRIEPRFMKREFKTVDSAEAPPRVDLKTTSSKDFNQFLGNNRDSVVRGRVLNANWDENPPKILWKQSVGEGWSGFVAVNGFAVTQEQRGQDECVTCYNARTGELLWIYSAPRRHEDTLAMGKAGPRATPAIHEGRVYAQGATGILDCLDGATGELVWSADIPDLLGTDMTSVTSSQGFEYEFEDAEQSRLAWGRSGSPLVYKDLVIATGGVQSDKKFATLIAFDKNTGEEVWRGGSRMIAYGSPTIHNLLGRDQITIGAEAHSIGISPEDGSVLWEVSRPGSSNQDANVAQITRVSDNRILLTKGYGLGGQLIELSENEGLIETNTVWQNQRVLRTKMMTPVLLDGYAYSLTDGFVECSSMEDGEEGRRVWRKRARVGNGQLLLVGDKLLVHTETGELKLVKASPDGYQELGEIETIDGICWNTICLYDNLLLVRSELEAACIELKLETQTTGVETGSEATESSGAADGNEGSEADADGSTSAEVNDGSTNGQ